MEEIPIRENLLVTMGVRAGVMDVRGYIDLPTGVEGEAELAAFVSESVTNYMKTDDVCFDEYIETVLTQQYGKKKSCRECWNWKYCGLSHGHGIGNCKVRGTVEKDDTTACESFRNE